MYTIALKNFFNCNGRINRRQFFVCFLISFIPAMFFPPLGLIVLPSMIKRLHDTGRSGMWSLCLLIPLISLVEIIFCLFHAGTKGKNRYDIDFSENIDNNSIQKEEETLIDSPSLDKEDNSNLLSK